MFMQTNQVPLEIKEQESKKEYTPCKQCGLWMACKKCSEIYDRIDERIREKEEFLLSKRPYKF
jgi:hypothetical protein